jgi:hypothetical protein
LMTTKVSKIRFFLVSLIIHSILFFNVITIKFNGASFISFASFNPMLP